MRLAESRQNSALNIAFGGKQSIGKSSLVNALTGSNLVTMDANNPTRTTCCIDAINCEGFIVYDLEGYNSCERKKGKSIEVTETLYNFAFLVADCFVLLIEARSVDNYNENQCEHLCLMLRNCLKIEVNEQRKRKKVIIVLQNAPTIVEDFESYEVKIKDQLDDVWDKVRNIDTSLLFIDSYIDLHIVPIKYNNSAYDSDSIHYLKNLLNHFYQKSHQQSGLNEAISLFLG